MDKRRLIIIAVVVGAVIVIGTAAGIYLGINREARQRVTEQINIDFPRSTSGDLAASGFIEAEEIELAAELGGRISELPFEEGDEVQEGDVVVRLDTSLLDAQRRIAEAQLEMAVAQRDLVAAGARPELVQQAEAQVAAAQAAVDAARTALGAAAALRDNPQDIRVQVIDAETQARVAQEQVYAAQAQFDIAQRGYDGAVQATEAIRDFNAGSTFQIPMPLEVATAPYQFEQAQANLQSAREALEGATVLLGAVRELEDNPAAIQLQVAQASASLETAQAALERANAELAQVRAGAREEDIAVAEAQIEEAQAALDAIDIQREYFTITSPIGGIILQQTVNVGELAIPATPLVTVANLDVVELTVYLSATQFNLVSLNQDVSVTVNSFPGRVFEGRLVQIPDKAEFTPRNVQTREERVNLVYAVRIQIPNPDHALKPGMPADARFTS